MKQSTCLFIPVVIWLSSILLSSPVFAQLLMRGTDISALPVLENAGASYSDGGIVGDAIDILESNGVNWHRLRIFVDPTGTDPFVVQDLNYTINLAQRAKANGSNLLLDFHYSDTWADPGKQFKPAAWSGLSFNQLEQQVYDYTKDVIQQFDSAGVMPEMVQIGNEIGNGLLWDDGRLWKAGVPESTEFDDLATLLSAGINGARDGAGAGHEPDVMIHHANGANWGTTSYYFDRLLPRLQANGTDIDAIGYSYYPKFHYNPATGAGDIADVQQNLNNTVAAYNKPVVIVEAGFASRGAQFEPTYEFPVSAAGQKDYLQAVVDAVEAVPNDMGQGVFWWYPEAVPVSGLSIWEGGRYGLFDQTGGRLPALDVFAESAPPETAIEFSVSLLDNANSWPGSGADAGIYGQGFSPSIDADPDPGYSASTLVGLDRFSFFKDGHTDSASDIKLAIVSSFFMDLSNLSTGSPELVGLSTNTIASTVGLAVGDPYSFEFDGLQLEYGSDYGAIFVNEDGQGNLTPIKVSALTADYAETPPGSGIWLPITNYGSTTDFQYSTSNFIDSNQFGDYLTGFSQGGDARFEAVFDIASLAGDFDGNGKVDGLDFLKWQSEDGSAAGLALWQANYGSHSLQASAAAVVPEPGSLVGLAMAMVVYLAKPR